MGDASVAASDTFRMNGSRSATPSGTKITSLRVAVGMLVVAFIAAAGGALLLGDLVHTFARIMFGLSDEPFTVMVLPGILLLVAGFVGTAMLALAFLVENGRLKWWIVFVSIGLPVLIELVDLTIRGIAVINEIMSVYGQYL